MSSETRQPSAHDSHRNRHRARSRSRSPERRERRERERDAPSRDRRTYHQTRVDRDRNDRDRNQTSSYVSQKRRRTSSSSSPKDATRGSKEQSRDDAHARKNNETSHEEQREVHFKRQKTTSLDDSNNNIENEVNVRPKSLTGSSSGSFVPKRTRPVETNETRLKLRQKQIDYGKNTIGYETYRKKVPKSERKKTDPRTPDKFQICSKRSWEGQMRKWRKELHAYDPTDSTLTPSTSQQSLLSADGDDEVIDRKSLNETITSEEETPTNADEAIVEDSMEDSIDLNDASTFCLESIEEMLSKGKNG